MNIHFNGIKYDGLAYIDDKQAEKLKNVEIQKDDVLLNITGASIGRVCLAEEPIIGGRVNQHVSIIRANERVNPKYLNLYMSSPPIQDFINDVNYGVTRQAFTKTQLLNTEISFPSIEEQQNIVNKVDNLFSKAEAIQEHYEKLQNRIETLPQAILQKAFKGELVEQLQTDGDAKALLKEIKELKKEVKPKKRKK